MPYADPLARKAYCKAHYQANKAKRLAYTAEYKRANRDSVNVKEREGAARRRAERPEEHRLRDKAKSRAYREAHKGQMGTTWRRYQRKFLYGLSHEEFEQLLEKQGGACPGCDAALIETTACVDHCHKTGRVRGLLCRKCNLSAGHANDDPDTLRRLAAYLEG